MYNSPSPSKASPSPSPSPLSVRDYSDLLVAAVEGGTGYWAYADDYKPTDAGTTVTLGEIDETDGRVIERFKIDSNSALWHNAVANAAEYMGQSLELFYEDHDAGSADIAAQFYCFGEVRYG